jgi:prevent-host-death family protein
MRAIGVRELKIHASRILRRLRETQEGVPITYRGRVVAHVVPAEEYERLKEGRPDFWQALRVFRERSGVASLDLGDELGGVRSRSKGRDFKW